MPPVPKKADCPKDSRPVKPNKMSKPMPKMPHIRMRLIVVGAKPRYGRMNGAMISPTAVSASTRKGRCLSIRSLRSFSADCAEQAVGSQDQYQCHGNKKHDVGVAWVEHRGNADDLAGDQATQDCSWKGADTADDDDHEGLDEDSLAHVGSDRHHRGIDDAGKARGHGADAEHEHEHLVDVDAERIDHDRVLDPGPDDHADAAA